MFSGLEGCRFRLKLSDPLATTEVANFSVVVVWIRVSSVVSSPTRESTKDTLKPRQQRLEDGYRSRKPKRPIILMRPGP